MTTQRNGARGLISATLEHFGNDDETGLDQRPVEYGEGSAIYYGSVKGAAILLLTVGRDLTKKGR